MSPACERLRKIIMEQVSRPDLEYGFHIRCLCHVINRCVIDGEAVIKHQVQKLRSLLKAIRASDVMRVSFNKWQKLLGREEEKTLPNLDDENRWNSMYAMVNESHELKDVFEATCN